MKIKFILMILFSIISCNNLILNEKNKVLIDKKGNHSSVILKKKYSKIQNKLKKIIEEDKEKDKEEFVSLLKSITDQEYCEDVFLYVSTEILRSTNLFYLKEFLSRIEEFDIPDLYKKIRKILDDDSYKLVGDKKLDHIKEVLEFYDRRIKDGYNSMLLKILERYVMYSESERDIDVDYCVREYSNYRNDIYKDIKGDPKDTYEEWDEKRQEEELNDLINILKIFKEKDVWNKEGIGKVVDIAIKKHRFNAVKIILHFAKEKGLGIKDILNIPLIKLLSYYYWNGEFKRETGKIPTSKEEEVKRMFIYLLEEGASLSGHDEEGYTIFWKMVTCLKIKEIIYTLTMIYKYRGEEELCAVINEVSKNGQSVYYRMKKEERKTGKESYICKIIEGNPGVWKIEIGKVIRENWEKNKEKLTRKVKVKKEVIKVLV